MKKIKINFVSIKEGGSPAQVKKEKLEIKHKVIIKNFSLGLW